VARLTIRKTPNPRDGYPPKSDIRDGSLAWASQRGTEYGKKVSAKGVIIVRNGENAMTVRKKDIGDRQGAEVGDEYDKGKTRLKPAVSII
jgi:hypothetical protein